MHFIINLTQAARAQSQTVILLVNKVADTLEHKKTSIKMQLVAPQAVFHHSSFLCCWAVPALRSSLLSSPRLKQATHLVSFLLVRSPLPRSNKGVSHYNWHPAGQLSRLGELPLAHVWVNTVDVCSVLPLQCGKPYTWLILQIIPHLTWQW